MYVCRGRIVRPPITVASFQPDYETKRACAALSGCQGHHMDSHIPKRLADGHEAESMLFLVTHISW